MNNSPLIKEFFDKDTGTFSYVVYEKKGSPAIVIDSVLNYDPKSGRTRTSSADQVVFFTLENELKIEWILETHAHADHLTASAYLKEKVGGKVAIGNKISFIQKTFKDIFNLGEDFSTDGAQFDYLLNEKEEVIFGNLAFQTLFVPGHTCACVAYKVGDAIFTGDTIFMPDVGTARCDFPGGDASTLYESIQKLLSYPKEVRLFMCHDYPPNGREIRFCTTVADQKKNNIHIHDDVKKQDFVEMRNSRDKNLALPVLMIPSIQINIRAGHVPSKESNNISYLKIPINLL
jgi:glyoxylase-like metal-dependent hydrolase (beta-lactamase superfamily II)